MRKIRAKTSMLLVGSFTLLILHLCKDYIDPRTLSHRANARELRARTESHKATPTESPPLRNFWPRCKANASAANVSGFASLPRHIQDFLSYRHCRHFPMLLDVPGKCGGAGASADVFLLLVIKTSPGNYDRRQVLRNTWAQERQHNGAHIRRVFLSGTAESGREKERLNRLLALEQRQHADILQWDFADSFYNLTLKQLLFLEWMGTRCPEARFLLNGDDDVFVSTDNMVVYLQGLAGNDGDKHLYTGHLIQNVGPIRIPGSKYYVPVQVQESEKYPPYCGGGGFLLSGYTASVIYRMSHSVPVLPIDDVYLGMCLAKARLAPSSHMGVKTAGLHVPNASMDRFDPCYYRDMLLVHRFLPAQMYLMWHQTRDPDLEC